MARDASLVDPLFIRFQQALAGRYSIDRELGRGGMGVVYLAREVHLDRPVAIKLLPPHRAAEPALRLGFLREARLAAKLSHPNIVPIHAVEESGDFVFYVMAFVDGETLAQRVRERGPLPSSEGARVLREVAWALAYAHEQGLVHRDVKPDNIMLEASTGRVLIGDFGIAAVAGDEHAAGISGTPEFMSPEQALGGDVDARSDLYGLGATAYYAFTGRFLFEGASATEVLARQITEAPAPLASVATSLPRKLASLIDRCVAKSPEQRPESAKALAEQLGVALEQRRELPAALRYFVKRQGRLNGGGTLLAGFALLPTAVGMSSIFGGEAGFVTLGLGVTAAPFAYLVGVARRLMRLGFTHADVGPAFRREIEQAREELSVERTGGPRTFERGLTMLAKISSALAAVSLGTGLFAGWRAAAPAVGWSFSVAALSTLGGMALMQRHKDVDTEFWSRIWMGRIGRAAFALAGRLGGPSARTSAMTHRATELSLGMAAEHLYDSLPREVRQSIGDLPGLLRRLQGDAQLMRQRYDDIQAALGDASDATSAKYVELRQLRDVVHAKLGDAVTALETIRLNLLRLHAGSATVEGLTTHLGMAAEVSSEIARLVAAHDETEQVLKEAGSPPAALDANRIRPVSI
jgi:eukaryotic-like serine/threonine-protein kinase